MNGSEASNSVVHCVYARGNVQGLLSAREEQQEDEKGQKGMGQQTILGAASRRHNIQAVRERERRAERKMNNEGQAKVKMKAKNEGVVREKQAEEYRCRYVTKRTPLLYPRS